MTRVKISAGILLFLVAFGIFSEMWLNAGCMKVQRDISAMTDELRAGSDCYDTAQSLESHWNSFRRGAVMLVKSDRITDIDRSVARIVYLSSADEQTELPADLMELWHIVEMLRRSEQPALSSKL